MCQAGYSLLLGHQTPTSESKQEIPSSCKCVFSQTDNYCSNHQEPFCAVVFPEICKRGTRPKERYMAGAIPAIGAAKYNTAGVVELKYLLQTAALSILVSHISPARRFGVLNLHTSSDMPLTRLVYRRRRRFVGWAGRDYCPDPPPPPLDTPLFLCIDCIAIFGGS